MLLALVRIAAFTGREGSTSSSPYVMIHCVFCTTRELKVKRQIILSLGIVSIVALAIFVGFRSGYEWGVTKASEEYDIAYGIQVQAQRALFISSWSTIRDNLANDESVNNIDQITEFIEYTLQREKEAYISKHEELLEHPGYKETFHSNYLKFLNDLEQ